MGQGPKLDQRAFDDNFKSQSFHLDEMGRLLAIDVMIYFGGRPYSLTIETYEINAQRAAENEDMDPDTEPDPTFVIGGEEILPSDLLRIKESTFEYLAPFLVEQDLAS